MLRTWVQYCVIVTFPSGVVNSLNFDFVTTDNTTTVFMFRSVRQYSKMLFITYVLCVCFTGYILSAFTASYNFCQKLLALAME